MCKNPILAVVHFNQKNGRNAHIELQRLLTERVLSRGQIAEHFGMNPGQFSVFVNNVFDFVPVIKQGVADALDRMEALNHTEYKDSRRRDTRIVALAGTQLTARKEDGGTVSRLSSPTK